MSTCFILLNQAESTIVIWMDLNVHIFVRRVFNVSILVCVVYNRIEIMKHVFKKNKEHSELHYIACINMLCWYTWKKRKYIL